MNAVVDSDLSNAEDVFCCSDLKVTRMIGGQRLEGKDHVIGGVCAWRTIFEEEIAEVHVGKVFHGVDTCCFWTITDGWSTMDTSTCWDVTLFLVASPGRAMKTRRRRP